MLPADVYASYDASYINENVFFNATMSSVNATLYLNKFTWQVYLGGYYSLYNSTIQCQVSCNIVCDDDSFQWFNTECTNNVINSSYSIRSNCTISISNCNIVNDSSVHQAWTANDYNSDNATIILADKLSQVDNIVKNIELFCDDSNGDENSSFSIHTTYGVGYPINVGLDIINLYEYGTICCGGYRSCFGADSITSNSGNILCTGYQSCVQTSLYDSNQGQSASTNASDTVLSIMCLAAESCMDSTIQANNEILCLATHSCKDSQIISASVLYCTMQACSNAVVRSVDTIYFFDKQIDTNIFSNHVGTMRLYLRGINAGSHVILYCNTYDVCLIDCGTQNSCYNMLIYCFGKCRINCNETAGISCPVIVSSVAPSDAPTSAPTLSPTKVLYMCKINYICDLQTEILHGHAIHRVKI